MKFQKQKISDRIIDNWDKYCTKLLDAAFKKTGLAEFDKKKFSDDDGKVYSKVSMSRF